MGYLFPILALLMGIHGLVVYSDGKPEDLATVSGRTKRQFRFGLSADTPLAPGSPCSLSCLDRLADCSHQNLRTQPSFAAVSTQIKNGVLYLDMQGCSDLKMSRNVSVVLSCSMVEQPTCQGMKCYSGTSKTCCAPVSYQHIPEVTCSTQVPSTLPPSSTTESVKSSTRFNILTSTDPKSTISTSSNVDITTSPIKPSYETLQSRSMGPIGISLVAILSVVVITLSIGIYYSQRQNAGLRRAMRRERFNRNNPPSAAALAASTLGSTTSSAYETPNGVRHRMEMTSARRTSELVREQTDSANPYGQTTIDTGVDGSLAGPSFAATPPSPSSPPSLASPPTRLLMTPDDFMFDIVHNRESRSIDESRCYDFDSFSSCSRYSSCSSRGSFTEAMSMNPLYEATPAKTEGRNNQYPPHKPQYGQTKNGEPIVATTSHHI